MFWNVKVKVGCWAHMEEQDSKAMAKTNAMRFMVVSPFRMNLGFGLEGKSLGRRL